MAGDYSPDPSTGGPREEFLEVLCETLQIAIDMNKFYIHILYMYTNHIYLYIPGEILIHGDFSISNLYDL